MQHENGEKPKQSKLTAGEYIELNDSESNNAQSHRDDHEKRALSYRSENQIGSESGQKNKFTVKVTSKSSSTKHKKRVYSMAEDRELVQKLNPAI